MPQLFLWIFSIEIIFFQMTIACFKLTYNQPEHQLFLVFIYIDNATILFTYFAFLKSGIICKA